MRRIKTVGGPELGRSPDYSCKKDFDLNVNEDETVNESQQNNISELAWKDHRVLMARVKELLHNPQYGFRRLPVGDLGGLAQIGWQTTTGGKKNAVVVTADQTAMELGGPQDRALSTLLWSKSENLLEDSIWIAGHDFADIKSRTVSYTQLVMIELPNDYNSSWADMVRVSTLTNRISGYMTRSLPGKLWVRIGFDLMQKGFSLHTLGQCLVAAYREGLPGVRKVEVVLAANDPELVSVFEPIHNSARAISGENQKLTLEADGTLSCDDLDCTSCEEKPACDTIRDVIRAKRSN
ncbi:MAG: hypothetical protein ACM3QW_08315 [Ignavibacteriales bacterium]